MTRMAIIGAGEIGQAINKVLQNGGQNPQVWDSNPAKNTSGKNLEEVLKDVEAVFFCVPARAIEEVIQNTAPFLKKGTIIISLAKGLLPSGESVAEILEKKLPSDLKYGILGGPMLAEELAMGGIGIGVFASKDIEARKTIQELFSKTNLKIFPSDDPRSVSLSGVLKNIFSFALGVADGIGLSENEKSWIVVKGLEEMKDILEVCGGNPDVALGMAGLGDFITTGYSKYSKNREAGEELIKTGKCDMGSESMFSLPGIINRLGENSHRFELLNAINNICSSGENAKEAFQKII